MFNKPFNLKSDRSFVSWSDLWFKIINIDHTGKLMPFQKLDILNTLLTEKWIAGSFP